MRQDMTTPAQVRGMIAILANLGLTPEAVVVDDYDLYQLPRPADKAVNLDQQPADKAQPFALVFGEVVSEVSELWKIIKRTDLGTDAEVKAAWLVRQVKPEIDTADKFRALVLSQPKFRAAYTDALAAALKG
jgi:hypothetical protein